MSRIPGGFGINEDTGVRRRDRSVSMGQAWAEALLERAQQGNPGVGGRPDPQVPDWVSNVTNSAAGQILGQPDLASQEAAFSEWAAQGASMTPAAMMQQQRLAGGIDEALDWVRPLALADLGVAGAAGRAMIPIPGGLAPGAAPAARTARRAGGGIAGALRQLLSRGGDEAVRVSDDLIGETFGLRTVRGSGDSATDPWQSTLRETTTRTTEDGRRVAAETAEFDALPDDAWVRAYHGTTPESARLIRSEGRAGGRGFTQGDAPYDGHDWSSEGGVFVTPTPASAVHYAKEGGEILEVIVRKGDLRTPHQFGFRMPVGETPNTGTLGESFFDTLTGVRIPEGGSLRVVRSHKITPELKQQIEWMKIRAAQSEPLLPPTPNPGSVV